MAAQRSTEHVQWLSPGWWGGRPRNTRRHYVMMWLLVMIFGPTVWDLISALAVLLWYAVVG